MTFYFRICGRIWLLMVWEYDLASAVMVPFQATFENFKTRKKYGVRWEWFDCGSSGNLACETYHALKRTTWRLHGPIERMVRFDKSGVE